MFTKEYAEHPIGCSQLKGEINMDKLFKSLSILAAIALFITACSAQVIQAQPEEKGAVYQVILGRSLNDKDVTDFIASNNCSPVGEYQLCNDAGIAFWGDSNQLVKIVYLYSGTADGFRRYRGDLPFGLSFYDPMWRVEEKLRDLDSDDALQQAGLPEEGSSPDHFHYWAVYKRLGMTVIYNSPAADQDAYIYAILLSN
jgi:hypothetical protein